MGVTWIFVQRVEWLAVMRLGRNRMGSHEGSHGVTWTKVAPQFGLKVSQKVAPQKKAAECSVLAQAPILLLRSTSLSLLPAAQAAERKFCHEPLASLRPRTSGITCTPGLLRNLSSDGYLPGSRVPGALTL